MHGEYALVVLDESDGSALLTHDATGTLSLFYSEYPAGLAFATHLLDLVDGTEGVTLDEDYLADHLALGMYTGARTPYAGISRLVPGHSLRFERGRVRLLPTWELARARPLVLGSAGEYEERLRELLEDAVGAAASTGRVAADLSGGLDSSTVVALAAGARPDLDAISLVYPAMARIGDEPWMRDVVEATGVRWHRVDCDDVLPFAELPRSFAAEPSVEVTDVACARRKDDLLRELGADVLLTGAGGDAVLHDVRTPRHLADPFHRLRPIRAARELAAWRRESEPRRSWLYWAVRHVLEPSLDHLRGRTIGTGSMPTLPAWISREYADTTGLERRPRRRATARCRTPGLQALSDELWTMGLTAAVSAQRATPYERRRPLLHAPLVEFMFRIPWEEKLRPDRGRHLQRRALRGVLPESVRSRTGKSGYSQPIFEGLRRNRDWTGLLTDAPRLAARGMVDLDRWREAVAQARFGRTHTDRHFLAAVSLEVFLQQLERRTAVA